MLDLKYPVVDILARKNLCVRQKLLLESGSSDNCIKLLFHFFLVRLHPPHCHVSRNIQQ